MVLMGFPGDAVIKNPPANARYVRDMGMIPGIGISLRVRNDNSLQCSCLEIQLTEEPGRLHGVRVRHN